MLLTYFGQSDEGDQTATDNTSVQWPQLDSSPLRVDDDSATWNSDEAWEPDTEPLESDPWGPVYNEPAGPVVTKKRRRRRGVPPYLVHEKEGLRPYRKYRQLIGELKFQRPVVGSLLHHQVCCLLTKSLEEATETLLP